MRRTVLALMLAACGGAPTSSDPDCGADLRLADAAYDACADATVELRSEQTDTLGTRLELVVALDDGATPLRLGFRDLCGPGRLWIGGGVEAQWAGADGPSAVLGTVDVLDLVTTPGDDTWDVEIYVDVDVEAADGTGVTGALRVRRTVDAPPTSQLAGTCSSDVVVDTLVARRRSLDVLFVVDVADALMQTVQQRLQLAIPGLLARVRAVSDDWHVGVVTSEPDDGGALVPRAGRRYATDGDGVAAGALLGQLFDLGADGDHEPEGLDALAEALGSAEPAASANSGFRRTFAALAVVGVTVREDESDRSVAEVVTALEGASDDAELIVASTVGPPVAGCTLAGQEISGGLDYRALTSEIGGTSVNVCGSAYDRSLDPLGRLPGARTYDPHRDVVPDSLVVLSNASDDATMLTTGSDWSWDPAETAVLVDPDVTVGDAIVVRYAEAKTVVPDLWGAE